MSGPFHFSEHPPQRVAIIGDASLAAQCIDLAIERGFSVSVVATDHAQVRARSDERGIPTVSAQGDLSSALDQFDFDVLFSIANLRVLPASVLDQAAISVNFHDGPLPDYAGLNVPTWALLDGRSEHAVTWHLMTTAVDDGAVIAVERFAIDPDETAFSLNARCYEAALASFPRVLDAVASGRPDASPQPDVPRRVFKRFQRPVAVIDPRMDAARMARTIRALAHGHAAYNSMGSVHLVAGGGHLVVAGAHESPAAGAAIGTITVDAGDLRLTCADADVVFDRIELPNGHAVSPDEALAVLGLSPGDSLGVLADDLVSGLRVLDPELARHEDHWRRELFGARTTTPDLLARSIDQASVTERTIPSTADDDRVLAAVATWVWRQTDGSAVLLGVTNAAAHRVDRRAGADPPRARRPCRSRCRRRVLRRRHRRRPQPRGSIVGGAVPR